MLIFFKFVIVKEYNNLIFNSFILKWPKKEKKKRKNVVKVGVEAAVEVVGVIAVKVEAGVEAEVVVIKIEKRNIQNQERTEKEKEVNPRKV